MPTTKEAVLDEALRLLGEPPISAPDSSKTWGRRVTRGYEPSLNTMFEDYPLKFAETVQRLSPLADEPVDYGFQFNKPAALTRTNFVNDMPRREADPIQFVERAGKILCNYEEPYIWFNDAQYKTQEGAWPQKFADWLSAEIAYRVHPVTDETDSTMQRLQRSLTRRKLDFKVYDGNQSPIQPQRLSNFAKGRIQRTSGLRNYGGYRS